MPTSQNESVVDIYWWEISRYDPADRVDGAYPADSWTSISDVGKCFQGATLTMDEYLSIEDSYVIAALEFMRESQARVLEPRLAQGWVGVEFSGDERFDECTLPDVIRGLLREEIGCKLVSPDGRFAIHIAYDLYMYVGSWTPCPRSERVVRDRGLYFETRDSSPYDEPDDE